MKTQSIQIPKVYNAEGWKFNEEGKFPEIIMDEEKSITTLAT